MLIAHSQFEVWMSGLLKKKIIQSAKNGSSNNSVIQKKRKKKLFYYYTRVNISEVPFHLQIINGYFVTK